MRDCVEPEMTATPRVAWFQRVPPSFSLGDGEVEGVAELVFERADDLAAVLERLRVRDGEFEGELYRWAFEMCEGTETLWIALDILYPVSFGDVSNAGGCRIAGGWPMK